MSKDFDSTLSGALDLAAAAAYIAGPEAARIRGRKRAVRQRIALSTLSVVLVVSGGGAAFALSAHLGGTPRVTGGSPSTAASARPTSGATHAAASSPPPSASASSSGPSPSASSPGTRSSSSATKADPQQVVDQAWLSPQQLPFASTFGWTAVRADPNGSSPIGQQLTPTVFYVAKDTVFQALTMCADPAHLLGRTTGAQHTEYTTASGPGDTASQFIFFFADASTAHQTFAWLQSQYGSCPLTSGGAQVKKTGGDGVADAAWLSLKASNGSSDMSAYNREYFVVRGSTIAYVVINISTTLSQAYDDAAQLSTITAHLCSYAGPCS